MRGPVPDTRCHRSRWRSAGPWGSRESRGRPPVLRFAPSGMTDRGAACRSFISFRSTPFSPPPARQRRDPDSRISCACLRPRGRAYRGGAVRAPSVMGHSPSSMFFQRRTPRCDFRPAQLKVDWRGPVAASLSRRGEAWSSLSVRLARLSGAHRFRVHRQALASVRGRRVGRQRHAWSSAGPECRSDKACSNATRRFGDKARDVHHRAPRPGEGQRWIAPLRACHGPPVVCRLPVACRRV